MKLSITCKNGKALLDQKRPAEASVSAPSVDIPSPVAPEEPEPSLPGWIVPLILAGLVAFSGMIVLVGWLIMKPTPVVAAQTLQRAPAPEPVAETKPPLVAEKIPISEDEPVGVEVMEPPALIRLQRRMPSRPEDPEFPVIPAAPKTMGVEAPMTSASNGQNGPSLRSPMRWSVETPSAGAMNLMMPIEVAKIDDGSVPFQVRRLRFPDAAPKPLKLAVTPFVHDDLGSVLANMGEGYRFMRLRREELLSFDALKKHDVVFLTCADLYARDFQAAVSLRNFVQQGGTLYASDLRVDLVLAAFPEFRAKTAFLPGVPQNIEASVVDPGLRSYLGRRAIPLSFDAADWRPAAFDPSKVTVCLQGMYRNNLGQAMPVPLLVKFRVQKGTVIFTSFHHTKNDSEIVRKLLEYLVFASLNARTEARIKELMSAAAESQFSTQEMRPVPVSADTKIEATWQHAGGPLQIALGFENLGAKLKLILRSPSGQIIEHEDQGLFLIEIPQAEPGAWHYTVTPIELPYANFPIILAVGGVKS